MLKYTPKEEGREMIMFQFGILHLWSSSTFYWKNPVFLEESWKISAFSMLHFQIPQSTKITFEKSLA